jgi:prolyl 4-hydroxylase
MYLTDVEDGGETLFPAAGGAASRANCSGKTVRGLSVKPKKGNAVMFFTMTPDAQTDSATIHGSCEVVKGEKWSATMWTRTGKFT